MPASKKVKCCVYCNGKPSYHAAEATRISFELESLGSEFAEGGTIRAVLLERIEQEKSLACD